MSFNGYPHYTEYMNLSINELSKKFKKNVLKELCYKYDNTQSDSTRNTLDKLKKVELVKRLYELLHTEDQSAQESIAIYHSYVDKRLKEKTQQEQEQQNKLSEYEDKLTEIESLMEDREFKRLFFKRFRYTIESSISWTPPSIDYMW